MRILRWFFSIFVLGIAISSCSIVQPDGPYGTGSGADLYVSDLTASTEAQESYVSLICRQTGLSRAADGNWLSCNGSDLTSQQWSVFVQAGMNDIDRRCDAYLDWLDDRRRSSNPVLQQISDTQAFVPTVLQQSGVGSRSIAIVAAALGYASKTFTNINSRLILAVNQSTVQTIVFKRRNDLRAAITNKTIDNRPAALYVLRAYLEVCTPMSIETDINSTLTVFQQAGAEGVDKNKMITVDPGSKVPTTITTISPKPSTVPSPPPSSLSKMFVKSLSSTTVETGKLLQEKICVPDSEIGTYGEMTPVMISVLQQSMKGEAVDGKMNGKEIDLALRLPGCSGTPLKNAYEQQQYKDGKIGGLLADILTTASINPGAGASSTITKDTQISDVRQAIKAIRLKDSGAQDVPPALFDQVTSKFIKVYGCQTIVGGCK